MAEFLNRRHSNIIYEDENFIGDKEKIIRKFMLPLSVPNEILLVRLFRQISKKNKVVLSGEGADELFFGYDKIFNWAFEANNWDLSEFNSLYSYGSVEDLEVLEYILEPHLKSYVKPIEVLYSFFNRPFARFAKSARSYFHVSLCGSKGPRIIVLLNIWLAVQ